MMLAALLPLLGTVIDKAIPDPQAAAQAKLEAMRLAQSGELETIRIQLSAIVAEAQSPDPWTSRARPSFLYVMYILILASIPMGIFSIFSPSSADALIKGMTGYLAAIPESLWWLFGSGYLGYTAARQYGKAKGSDR
jgi:hypothetical protein